MIMINENSLGYRIRTARCHLNLTQKQLAEEVGVGANYIAMVERGVKKPSQDLIERIAHATRTTTDWINGTSENQTAYPEADGSLIQTNQDSASIGYLVDLIRSECAKMNWEIEEPERQNDFPKTDWLPNYWFRIKNAPIDRWAFDLSQCVYYRPDLFSRDGKLSPKLNFANFISNVLFSNPMIRNKTKYTFVVPSSEIYEMFWNDIVVPLGNVSIMQVDIVENRVVHERYLCKGKEISDYLEQTLRFQDI